jgi:hypothetical protein
MNKYVKISSFYTNLRTTDALLHISIVLSFSG